MKNERNHRFVIPNGITYRLAVSKQGFTLWKKTRFHGVSRTADRVPNWKTILKSIEKKSDKENYLRSIKKFTTFKNTGRRITSRDIV